MEYRHVPVMLKQVLNYLQPQSGQNFIDATLGGASYTLSLAQAVGSRGKILSLDLDPLAIANAQKLINYQGLQNIKLVLGNFKNIIKIVADNFSSEILWDGLVADLGLSSAQLDDYQRGFSFKSKRPLDMSFGPEVVIPTIDIVNNYSASKLSLLFQDSGANLKWANSLAELIVKTRRNKKLLTTNDLLSLITQVTPRRNYFDHNSAAIVFQALRMETNGEKLALRELLQASVDLLKVGGLLVVVSFHSGEDRIVKNFLKNNGHQWQIITPHPLRPDQAELNANPRSHSAKLRVARLLK